MEHQDIVFEKKGKLGCVYLNRGKALNALTLDMVKAMDLQLQEWESDPQIAAVIVQKMDGRSFCAGGDVKAVVQDIMDERNGRGTGYAQDMFWHEYRLNHRIFHYPKPYIAIIDGLCMGGGMGLSAHGHFRVATENMSFAMPEVAIGFFPDVGAGHFLNKFPRHTGVMMGVTGYHANAADALYTGFATHYMPSFCVTELMSQLEAVDWDRADHMQVVKANIAHYSTIVGEKGVLIENADWIDTCFGQDTFAEMLSALAQQGQKDPFAQDVFEKMQNHSPTSLKLTFQHLKYAHGMDFDDVMVMEYRLSQACAKNHDFVEGVRALLIDKDQDPNWRPMMLSEVRDDDIEGYFAKQGEDLTF